MSYADSLLATGERIIHRERQHWLVLLWGARLPIVGDRRGAPAARS